MIKKWQDTKFNSPNNVKIWKLYCALKQYQHSYFLTTSHVDFLTSWQCGMVAKEALWRQMWVWPPAPLLLCSVTLGKFYDVTFFLVLVSFYVTGDFRNLIFPVLATYSRKWWFTVSSSTIYAPSLHRVNFLKAPLFSVMTSLSSYIALHFILNDVVSSTCNKSFCHPIPLYQLDLPLSAVRQTPLLSPLQMTLSSVSFLLIPFIFIVTSFICLWHQVSFPLLSLCSILPCALIMS